MTVTHQSRRRVILATAAFAALATTRPALAENWTANFDSNWNNSSNWAPFTPASSANTALTFGAAANYTSNNNLSNPFTLNSMTFTSAATSAYTIGGSTINFLASPSLLPGLHQNSGRNVTFTAPLTLSSDLIVDGAGAGTLFLNGAINGSGQLKKFGTGTAALGAANTFTGDVSLNGGTLALNNPFAIPSGRNVTVNTALDSGAEFRLGFASGSNFDAPIGTLSLGTGSTLRVPAGNGTYFVNRLSVSSDGAIDFSGASDFTLNLVRAGAGIDASGSRAWKGGGTSQIINDSSATIDFNLHGTTLDNGIPLGTTVGQGFRLTGGGTLNQTASGSTAPITLDGANFNFTDPSFVTSGTLTVQGTSVLNYGGTTPATLSKDIALGSGGGQIGASAPLTISGIIYETLGINRPLFVVGPLVLTGNNNYTGKTDIYAGGVASVPSIPNGGVQGPLGQSTSDPANLQINVGTLRYTGTTATTDRGFSVTAASAQLEVTNPATNLTFTGQVVGSGALNKIGPGTLTLSNSTNNYSGGTFVNAGTLKLGTASADQIPSGGNVTIAGGATFDIGSPNSVSNFFRPLGALTINKGTLVAEANAQNYSVGSLVMTGGALDLTETGNNFNFRLRGNAVTINASDTTAVWNGTSASTGNFFINLGSGGPATITVAKGTTPSGIDLDSNLSLSAVDATHSFIKSGPGVMRMTHQETNATNANLTVAQGALRLDDVGVFNGLTTPANSLTLAGGTFQYAGPTATAAANPLTIGVIGGTIETPNANVTLTLPGSISGISGLTKTGPGTMALTAVNTYLGPTTISGGTLSVPSLLEGANPLGSSSSAPSNLVIGNGTLQYTGAPPAISSRGMSLTDANSRIDVATAGASLEFRGQVTGAGALNKTGPGMLSLTTDNNYSGGTTVAGGTLKVTRVNGGSTPLGTGPVTVNASATLVGGNNDAFGYAGNPAPASININGGTVTTLGSNSYRVTLPNLTFTGGTLTSPPGNTGDSFGGNYSLFGNGTAATVTTNASNTTATISAGSISLQNPTTFNIAQGTTPSGVDLLINSAITPANGNTAGLTKTGPGTLTLTNSTNSYTGTTTINAGALKLGTPSADQIPSGGNVTVAKGATFDIGSPATNGNFLRPAGTITLNGGTMHLEPIAANGTYDGTALAMTGGTIDFTQSGSNVFELRLNTGVTINASGATAVWSGGTGAAVTDAAAGPLTITVSQGTTPNGIDLDSSLSLSKSFVKAGLGVMRMTRQSYGGSSLTVAEGKLRLDDVGVFNSLTNAAFSCSLALAGGTFQYGGPTATTTANPLTLGTGGGTIEVPSAATTLTLPGGVSGTGGLTKVGSGTLVVASDNSFGPLTVDGGTLQVDDDNDVNGDLFLRVNGDVNVGQFGIGTLNITGGGVVTNTGTGAIGFTGTGTVNVGGATGAGTWTSSTRLLVGTAGTGTLNLLSGGLVSTPDLDGGTPASGVNFNGGTLRITATDTDAVKFNLLAGGGTIDVPTAGSNFTHDGTISGAGGLTKTGPGTLVLSNSTNDYTGGTFVNAGTLKLGDASNPIPANGNVTVAAGATFDIGTPTISNTARPLGIITLNGGTLRARPAAGFRPYNAAALVMTGGTLDLSEAGGPLSQFGLRLHDGVTINASNTTAVWADPGDTLNAVVNGGTVPLPIAVAKGTTPSGIDLDSDVSLSGGPSNTFFVKTGPGLMRLAKQDSAFTNLTVAEGTLRLDEVGVFNNLTGTISGDSLTLAGGTFQYGGPTATADANPLTFGTGGGMIETPTPGVGLTLPGALGGAGGLTKTGAGTLTLNGSGASTFAGLTTVSAGTLALGKTAGTVAVPGALIVNAPATVKLLAPNQIADTAVVGFGAGTGGTATFDTNGQAETVAGLSGVGTITGGGTLTTGSVLGPTGNLTGGLTVSAGTTLVAGTVFQDGMRIDGTLSLKPRSAGGSTSTLHTLTIAGSTNAWTGKVDLADSRMIVDYTGGSPLATIANQIKTGRGGGTWTGNGITSSLANATKFGIGYGEASTVLGLSGAQTGTFGGQPADATSVLLRYTLYGDVNLDGSVGPGDFNLLATHFGQSGQFWTSGDLDGDGIVGPGDFNLLATNFGLTAPNGGLGLTMDPSVTAADWAALQAFGATVPEPGGLGLAALAGIASLTVRPQRHRRSAPGLAGSGTPSV